MENSTVRWLQTGSKGEQELVRRSHGAYVKHIDCLSKMAECLVGVPTVGRKQDPRSLYFIRPESFLDDMLVS